MADVESDADRAVSPDPSWRTLYRVGALAAGLAVILYIAALVLFVMTPSPPTSGGVAVLEHVNAHRGVYALKQVLWIAPNLLMMVVLLALVVALHRLDKSFALAAGVVAVASWAVSFAWPTTGEGSLAMIVLSERYAEAGTDSGRAPFVAGAELLLALNDLPATVLGVVQTLGIFLIAVLMLRSAAWHWLARLSVTTGAVGIVAEALRPWLGWAYAIYGLILFVWLVWVAVALWRLSATRSPAPAQGLRRRHGLLGRVSSGSLARTDVA